MWECTCIMFARMPLYVCVHDCMYVCALVNVCSCVCVYLCECVCMNLCMCLCVCVYVLKFVVQEMAVLVCQTHECCIENDLLVISQSAIMHGKLALDPFENKEM